MIISMLLGALWSLAGGFAFHLNLKHIKNFDGTLKSMMCFQFINLVHCMLGPIILFTALLNKK